jgi:hypothetical protein
VYRNEESQTLLDEKEKPLDAKGNVTWIQAIRVES